MSETWTIGLALNGVIGTAFVVIGLMLAVQLTNKGQWTVNRIGTVFTVLVLACGVGHLMRSVLMLGPSTGWFGTVGVASRVAATDWHMWIADGITAVAGVFYVVARTRDKDLLQTTRAFEDYRSSRARAIEVHDSVVQNLTEARVALQAGERETAEQALQEGLQASQEIISRVREPGAEEIDIDPEEVLASDG